MPITKVPIIHKFGIISQSQREELQDRLIKQTYNQNSRTPRVPTTSRNPLELTESFIQQFNDAETLEDKERLEEVAFKMLSRAKRRAGLKEYGRGNHVDLPRAWSELSMLAQCRGKIQEECLDMLIVSLHQASLSTSHIPSLFYLAETTLYWLRTDAMDQPFLRIGEIKLLKMGLSVFMRLFYHHMVGHLNGHVEYKHRLIKYLACIKECEEAYNPYPGAHLCLRFISEVGGMVVADALHIPMPLHTPETKTKDPNQILEEEEPPESPIPSHPYSNPPSPASNDNHHHDNTTSPAPHAPSPGFQSSIHDLSPALWHTLDVWRCVVHLGKGFKDAVRALALCGTSLSTEHWIDAVCAMRVLSEAAKSNITVLKTMQNLAKGITPQTTHVPVGKLPYYKSGDDDEGSVKSESSSKTMNDFQSAHSAKVPPEGLVRNATDVGQDFPSGFESDMSLGGKHLSDLSSHSLLKGNTSMQVMVGSSHGKSVDQLTTPSSYGRKISQESTPTTLANISSRESLESAGDLVRDDGCRAEDEYSEDSDLGQGYTSAVTSIRPDVTQLSAEPTLTRSALGHDNESGRSFKREVSFDIDTEKVSDSVQPRKSNLRMDSGISDRSKKTSSAKSVTIDPAVPNQDTVTHDGNTDAVNSFRNNVLPEIGGIQGWRWEVGFTYVDLMSNLCLYSNTVNIQKLALIGNRKDTYVRPTVTAQGKRKGVVLESAGLLDMAEFHASNDGNIEDGTDWSWRIRYAAIVGLVKITRCSQDTLHEGLRTVAWNALMRCHTKERDERVLEAFRVGQVEAQLELEIQKSKDGTPLAARLAAGLAASYLPPLAPAVAVPVKQNRRKVELPKPPEPRKGPNRLSLRQELMLSTAFQETSVDFVSRTSYDLKRIVEDQWRKEIQQQLEEEECNKQKELDENQTKEEDRQKELAEKKKKKFQRPGRRQIDEASESMDLETISPTSTEELSPRESLGEINLDL